MIEYESLNETVKIMHVCLHSYDGFT
jgi:hypothetical protein